MGIKVYVSGISGNKEVKKRQQRVLLILDSKSVKYDVIDIAEPGAEEAKDFMQNNSTSLGGTISDPTPRHPLPPQIFNDDVYCGDYDQFDTANEIDEMEKFLKLEVSDTDLISNAEIKLKNGDVTPEEKDAVKETDSVTVDENETLNEQDSQESLNESAEPKEIEESKSEESARTEESEKTEESVKTEESAKTEESVETKDSEADKEEAATGAGGDDQSDDDSEASVSKNEEKADQA